MLGIDRGVLPYWGCRGGGGGGGEGSLNLASSFDAKFGVRAPNKRKTWEVLVPQMAKIGM